MTNPTLAIIVGSNRRESINRKLAQAIAKLAAGRFDVSSPDRRPADIQPGLEPRRLPP